MSAGAAFGDMLVSRLPKLRRFALKLCRSEADADDLTHDCFCRALEKMDQFIPGTNLDAWLITIMRNHFLSALRMKGRVVDDPDGLSEAGMRGSFDQAASYEAREAIAILLTDVSREHADTLIGVALGDTIAELSNRLGVPDGTIKSRIHRGRKELGLLVG